MSEGNTHRPYISCRIIRETDKAYLVDDGENNVWMPKSQCEAFRNRDGSYNLFCEEWLMKQKGFL